MKRFHWPLERMLTVTVQRELALRSQLLSLLQRITFVRQEIVRRRSAVRSMLAELSAQGAQQRMGLQELFMKFSASTWRELARLRDEVKDLTAQRGEKTAELIKLRKSQETLERIREEAKQEHVRSEMCLEQKEFDESAQIAFAREARNSSRLLSPSVGV